MRPAPPAASRVLLVDDEPAALDLLSRGLEAAGITVLVATTGEAAVGAARTARPHLIVMDVGLDGPDGFETTARLKLEPATATIPVVFLTALPAADGEARARSAGAIDYIEKRPPWSEIVERIRARARSEG